MFTMERRRALITAAGITALVMAAGAASATNIGILAQGKKGPTQVGNLDLKPKSEPTVITIVVKTPPAAPTDDSDGTTTSATSSTEASVPGTPAPTVGVGHTDGTESDEGTGSEPEHTATTPAAPKHEGTTTTPAPTTEPATPATSGEPRHMPPATTPHGDDGSDGTVVHHTSTTESHHGGDAGGGTGGGGGGADD